MEFRAAEIAMILGGHLTGNPEARANRVGTDSRTIRPGDLFFALKGEKYDGDAYVAAAFAAGASICIGTSEPTVPEIAPAAHIRVSDGLDALQTLARHHRDRLTMPFVAVTGSNGKTTVKELIHHLASVSLRSYRSHANLNGQIGVPLSILQVDPDRQVAIIETGISKPGEMDLLIPLVRPRIAILTNIGPVHIEFFGSEHRILEHKGRLLKALPPEGIAILDGDDSRLVRFSCELSVPSVLYGFSPKNHLSARAERFIDETRASFELLDRGTGKVWTVPTSLAGRHNILNTMAALAAVRALGIPLEAAIPAVDTFQSPAMRQEMISAGRNILVINDAYNASPLSMRAALDMLAALERPGRKVAILGEMLELGPNTEQYHRELGQFAATRGIDLLVALGRAGEWIVTAASLSTPRAMELVYFADKSQLAAAVPDLVQDNDTVLVKASRGIALETIIPTILAIGRQP